MKCALVTGGSRGIGRAICLKLAGTGYYILVNYKSNIAEAEKTVSLIEETSAKGELLQLDVADNGGFFS
jgi:3-oxoacyl-[acyl-carrier protein] reductase